MSEITKPADDTRGVVVLERIGKAIPALAAMALILSITAEMSFLQPIGWRFLSYYSWQDFARNALGWSPVMLLIVPFVTFMGVVVGHLGNMRRKLRFLRSQIVELGGVPPSGKGELRRTIIHDVKGLRFWAWLLITAFAFYALLGPHPMPIVFIVAFYLAIIVRWDDADFAELWPRFAGPTPLLYSFALGLLFAALWGSFDGRVSLTNPENAQVSLKQDKEDGPKTIQCNILRGLSSVLIAACGGQIYSFNNAFVDSVKYDIDVRKLK